MVMLNSALPEDIRVLSWAPVGRDFSARFNCLHRTYKYFFPRGNMNLDVSYVIFIQWNLVNSNLSEPEYYSRVLRALIHANNVQYMYQGLRIFLCKEISSC